MTSLNSSGSSARDGSALTKAISSEPVSSVDSPRTLGDFSIEQELGRGGMGVVYRAIEKGLGRPVALKVLPPSHRLSKSQISRFQIEAKSAAQLSHDHIVPIYHIGYEDGIHYFAMRLIDGCDLEKLIRTAKQAIATGGSRTPTNKSEQEPSARSADTIAEATVPHSKPSARQESIETVIDLSLAAHASSGYSHGSSGARSAHQLCICIAQMGQAIADALHHAHQHGIVHRDIKPSNLMLDEQNKVWVTDFGLAQLQGETGLTKTGEFVGTLRYMSPEQASGRKVFIDHRTDIYSLGVTLYEMATLEKACQGDSPQELLRNLTFSTPKPLRKINSRLPRDFEAIINKAIERDPSDRYQSAADFADDLSRFARGQSLKIRRPQRIKKFLSWFIERPRVASALLSFVILVCLSLSVIAVLAEQSRFSESQRAELAESVVKYREGQQLSTAATLIKDENPGLAVAAALEGADIVPGPQSDLALMAAVDGNHEHATIPIDVPHARNLVVSPDGKRAIVCVDPLEFRNTKKAAIVVDLQTKEVIGQLESSTPITQAVFDPLNKTILTNSTSYRLESAEAGVGGEIVSGALQLWDSQSLRLLKTIALSPAMRISPSNFSPSGQQVVLPSSQGSATIYDLPNFAIAAVLPAAHTGQIIDAIYSSDGKRIVTWAEDATAVVWEAESVKKLQSVPYRTRIPRSTTVALTDDHERLCISGSNGTIVASIEDGKVLFSRREKMIAVDSPRHRLYVLGLDSASIYAINIASGTVEDQWTTPGTVQYSVLSQDGRTMAIASGDDIYLYNALEGQQVAGLRGHSDEAISVQILASEPKVASLGRDGTLRLWNASSDMQSRTLKPAIELRPKRVIASDTRGNFVAVGNVRTTHTSLYDYRQPNAPLAQLDGNYQLAISENRLITSLPGYCLLWDTQTRRKLRSIELPLGNRRTITQAVELSESRVALLCNLQQLFFWNLNDNTLSRISNAGEFATTMVKSGESQVTFGLSDGDLWQMDFNTLERQRLFRFGIAITSVTSVPSGQHLLVNTRNRDVFVWDIKQKSLQATLKDVDERSPFVIPLPEDRCLSYGDELSKSVKVWNTMAGTVEFELPITGVKQVAIAPDNQSAVINTTNRVMLWRWQENALETISEAPCSSLAVVGDTVLMATTANPKTPAQSASTPDVPRWIAWNTVTKKIESEERLEVTPHKIIQASGANLFWQTSAAYGMDVIDLRTNDSIGVVNNFRSPVVTASFMLDGSALMTVCQDGKIFVTDIHTGQRKLLGDHGVNIRQAAVSADQSVLLVADAANEIRKWSLVEPVTFEKVTTSGEQVNSLAMSRLGTTAVALLGKNECLFWDLRAGAKTVYKSARPIQSASLSTLGKKVLLISEPSENPADSAVALSTKSAVAEVVQLGSDKPSVTLYSEQECIEGVLFSNDERIAILTTKGIISIFDASSGQLLKTIVSGRPTSRLLLVDNTPNLVYAISGKRVTAWTAEGTQKQAFSIDDLLMDSPTLDQPQLLQTVKSQWYLLFTHDHLIKHPIDAVAYAKQIAPRKLTEHERNTILWTPEGKSESTQRD